MLISDFFLIFKVGGLVSQGIITEGMSLNLGPFEDGTFRSVVVTSIKRNRAPCRLVRATQSAALAIECHVNDVRKGMVLVDTRADDIQCTMLFKVTTSPIPELIWVKYVRAIVCGLLMKQSRKRHPENLKKILGAVWELSAK